MQSFSYQAFPQPFQDTSNLPSNLPFSHGQRPASAPPREPSAGHMPWQHDHPSGASSECFSMDPAQLEADIAALTSALTADSTAESLSGYPHPVKHARGYASHVTDHTGTPRQSQRYQEEHCSGMPAGREFTIPTRDLQTEHQHSWYDRHSPSRRADEPYASARAGPADGAAWSWSVHDQSTNMAGGESRSAGPGLLVHLNLKAVLQHVYSAADCVCNSIDCMRAELAAHLAILSRVSVHACV